MSVDKFGRHEDFVRKGVRGPPGEGFTVTSEGDYDLKNKRLVKLADPAAAQDAVSYRYMILRSLVTSRAAEFHFDANYKLLRNLKTPQLPGDAANVYYVNNHALTKHVDGYFDAGKKIIRNLQEPIELGDAVNLKSLQEAALSKTPEGNYDLKNKLLRNVSDLVLSNDAVNKGYVENLVPTKSDDHWNFGGKRLSNIGDPLYEGEAVNLRTLKSTTKSLVTYDKVSKTFKHDNEKLEIITKDPTRPLIYLDPKSKTGLRISGTNSTFHMHYTPHLYADHLIDVHGNRILWDEKNQRMYVKRNEPTNYWGDLTLLGDGEILQSKPPPITLGNVSKEDKSEENEFIRFEKGHWNALKRKIHNIGAGEDGSDAAIIDQVMQKDNTAWNAKKMKISNVAKGTDANDVAIYSQIPTDYMKLKNSKWDGNSMQISNVTKGVLPNDVATVGQIIKPPETIAKNGENWDCKGTKLINVGQGSGDNEVLTFNQALKPSAVKGEFYTDPNQTYKFIQSNTFPYIEYLSSGEKVERRECWDGGNMVVRNIEKGYGDIDACRMDQALVADYYTGDFYNAKSKPIRHLKPGSQNGEALTYEQALKSGPELEQDKGPAYFFTTTKKKYKFMKAHITGKYTDQIPFWHGEDKEIARVSKGTTDKSV